MVRCSGLQRSRRDLACAGQLLRQELLPRSIGRVTQQRKDITQVPKLQEQLTGMRGDVALHKACCRPELLPRACPGLWVLLGGTVTLSAAQTCQGWAACRTSSVSANVATSGKCEHQEDCGTGGRGPAVTFGWQEDVKGEHKRRNSWERLGCDE